MIFAPPALPPVAHFFTDGLLYITANMIDIQRFLLYNIDKKVSEQTVTMRPDEENPFTSYYDLDSDIAVAQRAIHGDR